MKKQLRRILLGAPVVGLLVGASIVLADTVSTNFETFTLGTPDGQEGWIATQPDQPPDYDFAIVDPGGFTNIASFGERSLRVSNAVTSTRFNDWIFAAPVTDAAGETAATAQSFPVGTRQARFVAEFDITSAVPDAEQVGLQVQVAPGRGDDSRMSNLRFEDRPEGIAVIFAHTEGTGPGSVDFVNTTIATGLDRALAHNIRIVMDFPDGPSNDIVRVYINGALVHTGTSWENYYYYDPEAAANLEPTPRITRTLLILARGIPAAAVPANEGYGFLFDNFVLTTGPSPVQPPTDPDDCRDGGWRASEEPVFRSAEKCIIYVVLNGEYDSYGDMIRALQRELRELRDEENSGSRNPRNPRSGGGRGR